MIRMVDVNRQSVAFCKYAIAGLLWLSMILRNVIPIYIVFIIMFISIFTGVQNSPLVKFYDFTFAKFIKSNREYINMYSMRFAHIVGCVFCVLALIGYYFIAPIFALIVVAIYAILQTIASFGYCSAQKLYECVVCNSNCCRFGKKVRCVRENVR